MGCANVLDGDVLYKHNPTLASFPVETFSKETRNPLVKSLPGIRILPACVMQTIRTAMRSTWLGRTATTPAACHWMILLLTLSVRWSNPSTQQTYAERQRVDQGSGKGQTKHGDQSTGKYTNGGKNFCC